MYYLDDAATVANGGVPTLGNPYTGRAASVLEPRHYHHLQTEVATAIEDQGITLNRDDPSQLSQAIQAAQPGAAARQGIGQGVMAPLDGFSQSLDAGLAGRAESRVFHGLWNTGLSAAAPYQGTSSGGSGGPGPVADPNDSTVDANEYETGLRPGELWPYVAPAARMISVVGGAGYYPACFFGTGTNHYESGWAIPAWDAIGSLWEFEFIGDVFASPGRCLEFVMDPATVAAGYDGLTSKGVGFQTPNLAPVGPFVSARPFWAKISFFLSFGEAATIPGVGNYAAKVRFDFLAPAWQNEAILEYRTVKSLSYSETVLDWTEDVKVGLRYKTTDVGQTIGSTASQATNPDTSNQGSTFSWARMSGFIVHRRPSGVAF